MQVILVGAGPGDAGLLTCAGRAALETADAVVHDRLLDESVLALIPPSAEVYDVGKTAGDHPTPQDAINALLLRLAQEGKTVVRLKGGDPYLFGRGAEELRLLRANGIPFRVIPGVTSALAAPAWAGIPVTHRDCASSVHIVTAHRKADRPPDYAALARLEGTLVFLMGVSALPEVCRGLLDAGMDGGTPAAVVERGATAQQRRYDGTLATLPDRARDARSPAVIVVGQVCALAAENDWYDALPLRGCTVAVTRPADRAAGLLEGLRTLGACALARPVIETRPLPDPAPLDAALAQLHTCKTVAFTSPAGVEQTFAALRRAGRDARAFAGCRLAAIGPATARALARCGLRADLVPAVYDSAHLAPLLTDGPVLLLRASAGSRTLPDALRAAGVPFREAAAYETVPCTPAPLPEGPLYVTFTSASTVRAFFAACPAIDRARLTGVCIGRPTADAANEYGIRCLVADAATEEKIIEEIVKDHGKTCHSAPPSAGQ